MTGAGDAPDPGALDASADAALSAAIRAAMLATDQSLDARFDAAGFDAVRDMDALTHARSSAMDAQVRRAWETCFSGDAASSGRGLALFAVGGYGREELFPASDIDLLLLVDNATLDVPVDGIARFLRILWDAGIPVGHAVRSAVQCTEASADITVLTSLLEARPLVAGVDACDSLADAVAPHRVWPARAFFEAKREELRARHARFGDTSDNLEPNIKEGPGGLRDLQTMRWMALRILGTAELDALVAMGQLGADEAETLRLQSVTLSQLRWGLHGVVGKREERLRFDHQKRLAARLTHVDEADTPSVERMMQAFYRSAALVLRLGERLLQRFEEQIEGEAAPVPVAPGFVLRRGYLAANDADGSWPRDADDVFDLFATWASLDAYMVDAPEPVRGLHSRTARALAEALPEVPAFDVADVALRARFLRLIRGPNAVGTLTRMARLGVLARWIPAFAGVSGRMQFDLFHVYTVDQHTIAVLQNIAGFASGKPDPRFSLASDVWPRLRKPDVLLLAALFHDIGKGRGGDHSELGAVDARNFCIAMGMSDADAALIEWLVRRHLVMSMTAQKQDISDPEVIHRFATEVADRDRLDNLYLLTCADIAGTSPKLWNAWKDRLLADLYTATRLALRRGLEHPVAASERLIEARAAVRASLSGFGIGDTEIDALFARMPDVSFLRSRVEQVVWQATSIRGVAVGETRVRARTVGAQAGAMEVFVHSPDRDGLFAAIVSTLDRLGMAIQQARVLDGAHGTVFDSFEVLPADARNLLPPADVERRLSQVLAGELVDIRPTRRAQPVHLKHFRMAPQIGFDTVSPGRTLMSLVCTDRPGLLADVALVLRDAGLRVHDARIATFGERAEDVFQITTTDPHGRDAALDTSQQNALRDALLACLDGECR